MGKQIVQLEKLQTVCLDTNIVAYYIEGNTIYGNTVKNLIYQLVNHKKKIYLTFLSLSELLVKPMREHEESLIDFYRTIDKNLSLSIIYPSFDSILFTAMLRAKYRIPTPDAINLSIAKNNNSQAFITNDESLKKVTEIAVFTLKDF